MERYVAFLRGMNLGGRRITNEDLRGHFEAIGFAAVATFRASGNVIFGAEGGEPEPQLAQRLEAELDARLGYGVPVFLRSTAEVAAIAAFEPFDPALVGAAKGFARGQRRYSERALRIANEVPSLVTIVVVILVIVRPF